VYYVDDDEEEKEEKKKCPSATHRSPPSMYVSE